MDKWGQLYGIGVGPGDPELLTIKGYRIFTEVPIIAYPGRRNGKSYALRVVETYFEESEKVWIPLMFPMTRDPEVLANEWGLTVSKVGQYLSQGYDMAFATEGDPLLFSTFIHLSRLVREKFPYVKITTIPGVTSMTAACAQLDWAMADGDDTVAIIPATTNKMDMKKHLQTHKTVVFIKVAKVLDTMLDILEELELTSRAAVVTKATADEQEIWTDVADLRGQTLEYLTLLVVKQ